MISTNISTGKVLVVDDDPAIQQLLKRVLEGVGNEVTVASDAREAFAACHRDLPDAIMLDLGMPGIDGYRLCEMLRDKFENIPIIIVTGSGDPETCSRSINRGATDFLAKPLNPGEVLIRVKNALQLRHLHEQLKDQAANQDEVRTELERVGSRFQDWETATGEAAKRKALQGLLDDFHESEEDDGFEALFATTAGEDSENRAAR